MIGPQVAPSASCHRGRTAGATTGRMPARRRWPRLDQYMPSASMVVDFPTPGEPVMPPAPPCRCPVTCSHQIARGSLMAGGGLISVIARLLRAAARALANALMSRGIFLGTMPCFTTAGLSRRGALPGINPRRRRQPRFQPAPLSRPTPAMRTRSDGHRRRIAETGRSKKGRMPPSDLISEVRRPAPPWCPATMPTPWRRPDSR